MNREARYRVIGLWQVWDDLPDAPAPQERPPEALIERLAGTFDHRPSDAEAERAVIAMGTAIRSAFEERELLGHLVMEDERWQRIRTEDGWLPEGTRRHPQGGRHVRLLPLAYDLDTRPERYREGEIWACAGEHRARLVDVADNLRKLGNSMGLAPVELAPDVPFFEGRAVEPERRRKRSRERNLSL